MIPQINPQYAAQVTASQGRGDDTELVHMSKTEIASLQALAQKHGISSLTRNPSTGLVEAGWLSSILPAVAGIGLATFAPGLGLGALGDFLGTGLGAGVAVGGIDALATGSLKQGLAAGLGAYGGASVAGTGASSIFGSSGASTATNAADLAAKTAGEQGATGAINLADSSAGAGNAANMFPSATAPTGGVSFPGAGSTAVSTGVDAQLPVTQSAYAGSGIPAQTSGSVGGIGSPAPSQMTMAQQLGANAGSSGPFSTPGYNQLFNAAAIAAPALMATPSAPTPSSLQNLQNTVRPYTFSQTPNRAPGAAGNAASPYFTQNFTALPTYVAGTDASTLPTSNLAGGGLSHGPAKGESLRGTLGALHGVEKLTTYAKGGISDLGSYSDGGQLLRGPGDGVSDSIPAQIGQHQPARLAEGEFVVPARIVSELGNGSTNAGAKKLYEMLNRVQAGRGKTMGGKNAYANDTNADKHLPA
jgi:hypothetical protein